MRKNDTDVFKQENDDDLLSYNRQLFHPFKGDKSPAKERGKHFRDLTVLWTVAASKFNSS